MNPLKGFCSTVLLLVALAPTFADSNDVMTVELIDGQKLVGRIVTNEELELDLELTSGEIRKIPQSSIKDVHLATEDELHAAKPAGGSTNGNHSPWRVSFGVQADYIYNSNDQKFSVEGTTIEGISSFPSWGISTFLDFTYLTIKLGFRNAAGDATDTVKQTGQPDLHTTLSSTLTHVNWAVELKYPLSLSPTVSWAPKIGLENVAYNSGGINGNAPSTDTKKLISPLYVTLGADLNCYVTPRVFVRPYAALGISTNADIVDGSTSGLSYEPSEYAFIGGIALGYTF